MGPNRDDKMGNGDGRRLSRFLRHLALLGIGAGDESALPVKDDPTMVREQKIFDAVGELPSLDFAAPKKLEQTQPKSKSVWWLGGGAVLAVAALVLLIVWNENQDRPLEYQVKGDLGSARVHFDQSGTVGLVTADTHLHDGAKVRVEVTANRDVLAIMVITNWADELLTGVNEAITQRILVPAGQKLLFPGSLELTGGNEGETVAVLICPQEFIGALHSSQVQSEIREILARDVAVKVLTGCKVERIRLR